VSNPYPWPVEPFDKQHPVRGFFNDPRIQDASHAFHFGIDVSAPDGTPVYSVTPGKVFIEDKGNAVAVQAPNGRAFGYWHVKPAVVQHQQVGLHQLLGHIEPGWGHVHLAESVAGKYLDPIRPGAIHPFVDVGHPTIAKIMFRRGLSEVPAEQIKGRLDICCIAYDTTPIFVPAPWSHMPVSPSRVRYRIICAGKCVIQLRNGCDLRAFRPPTQFPLVYGPDTRQNHPNKPGLYVYNLARNWNSASLPNDVYHLEVQAADVHGNTATSVLPFTVKN
jgi:Peptidase family M23